MINWINTQERSWEGTFKSTFFHDDENRYDFFIYIEDSSIAEYAEKCVDSFNYLPQSTINKICKGLIKCAKQGGDNDDFELPKLNNVLDILDHCWFGSLYVNVPADKNTVSYIVEGEGEWGEAVGFVIKNDKVTYVGVDYLE